MPEQKKEIDMQLKETIVEQAMPPVILVDSNKQLAALSPISETHTVGPSERDDLPPLPKISWGLLTLFASILCFCLIPSEAGALPQNFRLITSAAFLSGIITYLMHVLWFSTSLKQLVKHTEPLVPEITAGKTWRNSLLSLLPLAWPLLLFTYIGNVLFLSAFPLANALPSLVGVSLLYFVSTMLYWPHKLKGLCDANQQKSFPSRLVALVFSGFYTVSYIWYWREALKASSRKADESRTLKVSKRIKSADRMVIRYRPFIAIERWFQHRKKSTNKMEGYKNAAIAITADAVLIFLLFLFHNDIYSFIAQLLMPGTVGSAAGPGNGAFGSFIISNQTFLGLSALGTAMASSLAALYVLKQPTHFEFTAIGFKAFRWIGDRKVVRMQADWSDLSSIQLVRSSDKTEANAGALAFNLKSGDSVKVSLGAIDSVEDRETVLEAIERWAPTVSRQAEVVQALQPPVDHSYTELWLQALSAPPQRDRLKPLTENLVVGDDRYRVKGALGVGGQGAAYEAIDQVSEDTVVLKEFLLPIYVDMSVRKDVLESFESEARILKHLQHDQVVKLRDFFVEDHRAYLVLEHIDGQSLREKVSKDGALSQTEAIGLAEQMCSILTYLHSQQPPVVHRDFTPENLILRHDGVLKLIDFNVARQVESNATGSVVGKPAYLPPEQFRGQPVSQSDIYGMGATLHFLLTGKEPEPISPSHPAKTNTAVSAQLDKIVARATAINLKDRYQNAEELAGDLKALAHDAEPLLLVGNHDNSSDDKPSDDDPPDSDDSDDDSNSGGFAATGDTADKSQSANQDSRTDSAFYAASGLQASGRVSPNKIAFADEMQERPFVIKEVGDEKITLITEQTLLTAPAEINSSAPLPISAPDAPSNLHSAHSDLQSAPSNQQSAIPIGQKGSSRTPALSGQALSRSPVSAPPKAPPPRNFALIENKFSKLTRPLALLAAIISWLVVFFSVAWNISPQSASWLDPQAALHSHGHAAVVNFIRGNSTRALAECNAFLAMNPNDVVTQFGRAYIYNFRFPELSKKKAAELALPSYEKAASLAPDDYLINGFYGNALFQDGQYARSRELLKKVLSMRSTRFFTDDLEHIVLLKPAFNETVNHLIGNTYLYELNPEKALPYYESSSPNRPFLHDEYAHIMMTHELLHNPEQASRAAAHLVYFYRYDGPTIAQMHHDAIKRIVELGNINHAEINKETVSTLYDAMALSGLAHYAESNAILDKWIVTLPDYVDLYIFRAYNDFHLGQNRTALKNINKALSLRADAYALNLKARIESQIASPKKIVDDYWNYSYKVNP
jgi:serine/threonine protein kinase